MTTDTVATNPGVVSRGDKPRQTAAQRRAELNLVELAQATAERVGVCRRPLVMLATDQAGSSKYVGVPCKSTLDSVCPPCATRARHLRIQQAHEGWHLSEEPTVDKKSATDQQTTLVGIRASMLDAYEQAKDTGDAEAAAEIREIIADIDTELRGTGVRGRIPGPDPEAKPSRKRSTRRQQALPDLPRKKVDKTTVGRQYAGKYRPSMFVTLTLPSYGKVGADGAPVDPETYDYQRAARDTVHFAALFDRFIQNYRRATGRDVQYFATVEPQKRGAPHIHIGIRGSDPRALIRQLAAATYHQVWWPHFDQEVYQQQLPYWDHLTGEFVDPETEEPVPTWDEALNIMDTVDDLEPAHVIRFGSQIDVKGILGGTEEAARHVGYLTKYLTKSIGDVIEPQTQAAADHYDRLHAELCRTPCSPSCGLWFRYGIVPKGATAKTIPGQCKGKAHRRETLGLRGRRVLVSRKWTGKDLTDHKADRAEFVRQRLAEAGISKPEIQRLQITPMQPGDPNAPPREHLIMAMVHQKTTWHAEYTKARLAADDRPASPDSHDGTAAA